MYKRLATLFFCILALSLASFAASKKSADKSGPAPDKAYLEKLLAGWNTMDPANMTQYYAQGDRTFFDIAPLKYSSWEEYQKGVVNVLADFKTAKFTVNDDAEVHPAGPYTWATATVKEDATMKSGKREMANLRWTVVLEKQDGKWLVVHEHVSEPLQ